MDTKLSIAIQKSGRLADDSLQLLKDCDIQLYPVKDKLITEAFKFPLIVYFLRDDDIPKYVQDGIAHIGIVGQNVLYEKRNQVIVVDELGFGKCRLSLAVKKNEETLVTNLSYFNGKRIATSYPYLLKTFLSNHRIQAEIHEISGSVEIAPNIGLVDGICDLVSSGSTLFMNGLKEIATVLESQALLIKNQHLSPALENILSSLVFRIQSVKKGQSYKYILLNAPNASVQDIIHLLPGMKSPTVLPLFEKGWSSIHSVVPNADYWSIIEQIKAKGAEGILIIPIEKMVL